MQAWTYLWQRSEIRRSATLEQPALAVVRSVQHRVRNNPPPQNPQVQVETCRTFSQRQGKHPCFTEGQIWPIRMQGITPKADNVFWGASGVMWPLGLFADPAALKALCCFQLCLQTYRSLCVWTFMPPVAEIRRDIWKKIKGKKKQMNLDVIFRPARNLKAAGNQMEDCTRPWDIHALVTFTGSRLAHRWQHTLLFHPERGNLLRHVGQIL